MATPSARQSTGFTLDWYCGNFFVRFLHGESSPQIPISWDIILARAREECTSPPPPPPPPPPAGIRANWGQKSVSPPPPLRRGFEQTEGKTNVCAPPPPHKTEQVPYAYTGWPKKNGTVDFLGLCSDQQLSLFTLMDRTSFPHYNNT